MISIIVPVYNAERSLCHCVGSILALQYHDYELILVNDGSADESAAICDAYARQDARIRVIHMDNSGAAAARNAGLDSAVGEYILFCDADDCYDTAALDRFIKTALGENSPRTMYCFDFRNAWPNGLDNTGRYPKSKIALLSACDKTEYISSMTAHKTAGYSLWNKLYRRSVIEKYHIRMFERDALGHKDDWAEDLMFNLQYFAVTDNVEVTDEAAYLLTKHVSRDSENDDILAGRVDHMLNLLSTLMRTAVFLDTPELQKEFWKLAIWHMRRFLYVDARLRGVAVLRETCQKSLHWTSLEEWVFVALGNWSQLKDRWPSELCSDYRYMLEYIVSGNLAAYKIKNIWLWKIQPAIRKIVRGEP